MSLTTTSKNVKIGFALFVVMVIVYLLGKMIFLPVMKSALLAIFPPKNPPNPIYGQLAPVEFEPKKISNTASQPKYTLFTSDGKLPAGLPNRMTVYQYGSPPFSYEAGKEATETAEILGFEKGDLTTNLKGNEYQWVNPLTGSSLTIEINSKSLELKTPESSLMSAYSEGSMNKTVAVNMAKNYLTKIERFSDPLYIRGNQEVKLGTIENRNIEYTSYAGEAEIGYVSFFRSIGDYEIVGPTYGEGLIKIYVGQPKEEQPTVLSHPYISYNVREINTQSNATYPIVPVSTAWTEVSKGNGVISSIKPNNLSPFEEYRPVRLNEILINDIFLAYYDDSKEQRVLQPIYVFRGNYIGSGENKGTIAIYYPAISGEYIKNTETSSN